MATKPTNDTETIEITNFGGRLTRILNGDINSGYAKYTTSFGYDFYSKPGNLTWLEQASDITGPITDLVLAGKNRYLGEADPVVYMIGSAGKLYKMQVTSTTNPAVNSVIGISSVLAGAATYVYGASMEFFGAPEKIYIGSDNQVNSINFNGTSDAVVGSAGSYAPNIYHPLKPFVGNLLFGNGQTIGAISATGTVTSSVIGLSAGNIYSQLNPAPPPETRIRDIDVSPDNNYAYMSAATNDYEQVSTVSTPNRIGSIPSDGSVINWNGTDAASTGGSTLPSSNVTALQSYLQNNMFFSSDIVGSAISDGVKKILALPNSKSPFPNATGVNGDFLYWTCIEKGATNPNSAAVPLVATMYYFGSLDEQNPPGLYRLFRVASTQNGGNMLQTPFNIVSSTQYTDLNPSVSSVVTAGYGQHYFSTLDVAPGSTLRNLYKFNFPPTGIGTPQFGVYETQTQLFSKKIIVKQIRVYTEPTAVNNQFSIYLVGNDGNLISSNTYFYQAGTDVTKLQGSLERIDFNPAMGSTYAVGVRIINQGSTNMTIKKIEVDWCYQGK